MSVCLVDCEGDGTGDGIGDVCGKDVDEGLGVPVESCFASF